jgi:hypothetical protein
MKIYLAARFARWLEMNEQAWELEIRQGGH